MPKELKLKLRKQAAKRGLKGKEANAYVYGTMKKIEQVSGKYRKK